MRSTSRPSPPIHASNLFGSQLQRLQQQRDVAHALGLLSQSFQAPQTVRLARDWNAVQLGQISRSDVIEHGAPMRRQPDASGALRIVRLDALAGYHDAKLLFDARGHRFGGVATC